MKRLPVIIMAAFFASPAWGVEINEGLSGAWFNPETPGQGVVFDVVPANDLVFMAWFTFSDAAPAKLGSTDQRWLTAQGNISGDTANLTLFLSQGGAFGQSTQVVNTPVGEAAVVFDSCTEATLSYALEDNSGSADISLVRLAPDVYCGALSAGR